MYSESELQGAVDAGVLPPATAAALRTFIAEQRSTVLADEENFRLLTGFNDIFVAIAAAILLFAVGWIGMSIATPLAGVAVAGTAWALAEYFTRVRRMALPSILLVIAFAGGIAGAMVGLLVDHGEGWFGSDIRDTVGAMLIGAIALITAGATFLHWRRFRVPITVAAGAVALAATGIALSLALAGLPQADGLFQTLLLVGGIGIFVLAMWWDSSDRTRTTRRSDVAFWLHLASAPMIAHALFALLGVLRGDSIGAGVAVLVIAIYILFGIVALAIDRRALLVSALAYVLFALTQLMRTFGAVELNVALTALVIGSALLLLSAFWQSARRFVIARLPGNLTIRLPATVPA